MAQVSVTVNGNTYLLACADGEEEHINRLARSIDRRVADLVASVGQAGEARLILMASLVLADELGEANAKLERREAEAGAQPDDHPRDDEARSADIEDLADRIEAIADRLRAT